MAKEKCTKDVIRIAVKLKKHGALDKDIALACGVCPQTFSTWLHHPQTANQTEFSEAVKKCEVDFKDKLTQIIMRDAQEKVFPAYAGMIPATAPARSSTRSVPRIRGDDPWVADVKDAGKATPKGIASAAQRAQMRARNPARTVMKYAPRCRSRWLRAPTWSI